MANLYDDDIINKYLQDKLSQQVSDPEKTLDQQTFDFIKQHEGDKNVIYDDLNPNKSASTIEGTPTIGYGTTLSPKELAAGVVKTASGDVDISKPISDSDKQKMYVDDINQVKRQLANKINPDLMTTGQQVAAQSRAYNLGTEGAFGKDTKIGQLLAAAKADPLNASTYLNKMPAYMDEITSKGKVLPGLIDRRLAEADESQKSMSGISDLKKLDNTTIQEAKKLSPTGEINYAPPQQEELLKQATERSEQGFPKQLEEYDRTGKPPSRKLASETKKPSDIESIIAEYKAALEAANKKMELDPEELNKAKWMDALTGISRNIIQAGDSKQPLPDQTNYAAQYLNQAQQQRAGVKEGLDARAKLLQMYRGLNKGSGLTPYQEASLAMQDKKLKSSELARETARKESLDRKEQALKTPYGLANTEDDAKKLKEAHESKQNFDSKIDEMIELRKKHEGELLDREAVARGKQLSKDLLLEYKNMAKLGVLSKADEDIINAIIPEDPLAFNLSEITGQDPILSNLQKFKQDSNRDFSTRVQTRTKQGISDYQSNPPTVKESSRDNTKVINGKKYKKVQGGWEQINE